MHRQWEDYVCTYEAADKEAKERQAAHDNRQQ